MKKLTVLVLALLMTVNLMPILAQGDEEGYPEVTIPNTEARTIYSEIVEQEYAISVALPSDYARSDHAYPVLYVLQAEQTFGTVAQTVYWISTSHVFMSVNFPKVMVVGIGYPSDADVEPLQNRDFYVAPDDFFRFITEELVPFIDSTYRADPSERGLAGYLDSGYFALYTLFQGVDTFNRYLVIHPAFTRSGYALVHPTSFPEYEEVYAASHSDLPVRLFLSVGGLETAEGYERFAEVLTSRNYGSLDMELVIIEGATLMTVFSGSIGRGLISAYCWEATGCFTPAPVFQAAADPAFPPGTTMTTPDAFLSLDIGPDMGVPAGVCAKQSEVTILRVLVGANDQNWVELDCGRSTGWVLESDLVE